MNRLARTHAVALLGLDGMIVDIEADVTANLPTSPKES